MTSVLGIGDIHGDLKKLKKIPTSPANFILLVGDLGKADLARKRFFENIERKKNNLGEIEDDAKNQKEIHKEIHNSTISILKYLSKFSKVYFIQGNVGIPSTKEVKETKEKFKIKIANTKKEIQKIKNVYQVKNKLRILDGLRIGFLEYFTDVSWVKEFKPEDYKKQTKKAKTQTQKAKKILKNFGKNLDILVCHQPPFGILDKVNFSSAPKNWQGKHAGSKVILDYIKKYQPKFVLCGHIHEGEGHKKIGKTNIYNLGLLGHIKLEL